MLFVYTQLSLLVVVTLLLPTAVPKPISRRHFHDMLNSDEELDTTDDVKDDVSVDVSDYQADIYDNRITIDTNLDGRQQIPPSKRLSPKLTPSKKAKKDKKDLSKLLRPSPSDDLPIKYIKLSTSKDKVPKEHDLRSAKELLGSEFDSNYMSESRPLDDVMKPNGILSIDYKDFKNVLPRKELPPEIRHLTFSIPGKKHPVKIKSKKQRRKLRQKLWAHVSCPVVYRWRDLGPTIWPRWVKEGDCYKAHSCSIPAGMACKPEKKTEKTFLFWHCKYRSSCDWIKFQYPIITKCKCGC